MFSSGEREFAAPVGVDLPASIRHTWTMRIATRVASVALLSLAGCIEIPLPDDLGDEESTTTSSDDEADTDSSTDDETETDSATPDLPSDETTDETETETSETVEACCTCTTEDEGATWSAACVEWTNGEFACTAKNWEWHGDCENIDGIPFCPTACLGG